MLDLMTPQEMELELGRVFTPPQTTSLVKVLSMLRELEIQRAADTRALKQGLSSLTEEVRRLAEAQRQTDRSVATLAEAQRQMAHEMAESSRRTDQRFAEMSEAQREMQRALATFAQGMSELRQAVGSLANTFGFSLEEFVAALLPPYLARHYGVTDLTLERRYFDLRDGVQAEVDLAGEGLQDGQPVTVLAECQTTLGGSDVREIARHLGPVLETLAETKTLVVIVAMNVHPSARPVAQELRIQLIPYSRINRERE
jgi:prefoldin subunit 5